jgi:transcriptional regulator with XRE-family HTH domain
MRLRRYLDTNSITLPRFAKLIGVSVQSVHRYANGERIPRPEVMERIKRVTKGAVLPNDFYACREVA